MLVGAGRFETYTKLLFVLLLPEGFWIGCYFYKTFVYRKKKKKIPKTYIRVRIQSCLVSNGSPPSPSYTYRYARSTVFESLSRPFVIFFFFPFTNNTHMYVIAQNTISNNVICVRDTLTSRERSWFRVHNTTHNRTHCTCRRPINFNLPSVSPTVTYNSTTILLLQLWR